MPTVVHIVKLIKLQKIILHSRYTKEKLKMTNVICVNVQKDKEVHANAVMLINLSQLTVVIISNRIPVQTHVAGYQPKPYVFPVCRFIGIRFESLRKNLPSADIINMVRIKNFVLCEQNMEQSVFAFMCYCCLTLGLTFLSLFLCLTIYAKSSYTETKCSYQQHTSYIISQTGWIQFSELM